LNRRTGSGRSVTHGPRPPCLVGHAQAVTTVGSTRTDSGQTLTSACGTEGPPPSLRTQTHTRTHIHTCVHSASCPRPQPYCRAQPQSPGGARTALGSCCSCGRSSWSHFTSAGISWLHSQSCQGLVDHAHTHAHTCAHTHTHTHTCLGPARPYFGSAFLKL